MFDVNFWGVVNGSLAALPYLLGGGALINMGSDLPERDLPLQGMYSSSKHAVEGFTQALRAEVVDVDHAPISITLIQPGAPAMADSYYEQDAGYLQHKATRALDPMRIAEAILQAATGDVLELRLAQRRWPRAARGIAA